MAGLAEAGKPIREGFFVSEEQINRKFKLKKREIKPGEIAKILEHCGMTLITKVGKDDIIVIGVKGGLR